MGKYLEGKTRQGSAAARRFTKREVRDEARDRILEMVAYVLDEENSGSGFWGSDNRANREMAGMSDTEYRGLVVAALGEELKGLTKRYGY